MLHANQEKCLIHEDRCAEGFVLCQCRGCPLRGLQATPDLKAHQDRFLSNGWQRADAKDMTTIYRAYLDPAEKRR